MLLDDLSNPATPVTNGMINETLQVCSTQWHFTG